MYITQSYKKKLDIELVELESCQKSGGLSVEQERKKEAALTHFNQNSKSRKSEIFHISTYSF